MSKRFIDPTLWSDPDFQNFSAITKAGLLYLWAGSSSHVSGIFTIKRKAIIHEVFCGEESYYQHMLQSFKDSPFLVLDMESYEHPLVFVPAFLEINNYFNSPKNIESSLVKATAHIESVTALLLYYKVKKEKPKSKELMQFESKHKDVMKERNWDSTISEIENSGGLMAYIETHHSKGNGKDGGELEDE